MTGTSGEGAVEDSTRREVVAWVVGLGALAGAARLLQRMDRAGVTGGVLLAVVALAALAVALGGGRYGPEAEGRLDLSARLALGLLGGVLGGLAYGAAAWAFQALGLPALLGVSLAGQAGVFAVVSRLLHGAAWGLLFGLALPLLPGRGPAGRGALFSLVPALYVLLKVYPVDLQAGLFGVEAGALTFVFVLLYHLLWGLVAGGVMRWAERTEVGPVSRPLVET